MIETEARRSNYSALISAVAICALLGRPAFAQLQSEQVSAENKPSVRQDIARLREKLGKFRAGEISMQEGYLAMRALLINYSLLGEAASPEAQAIQREADDLQRKYPKVLNSAVAKPTHMPLKRRPFAPKDSHVMGVWGSEHKIAVAYQYRIEFFRLPENVFFSDSHGRPVFTRRSGATEEKLDLSRLNLTPSTKLTFKKRIKIAPGARVVQRHILVCTSLISGYTPRTDDERAQLPQDGLPYFRWEDKAGQHDDFCGVVSLDGQIIWKLNYQQASPGRLLYPVDIWPDGSKALICSGSRIAHSEGAEHVGNARELFIWEFPDRVTKLQAAPYSKNCWDLFSDFRTGKIPRP